MELGMGHSYFRPNLDEVILACVGLNDERNETMEYFCSVMDAHAQQIGTKKESVKEQAQLVYSRLVVPGNTERVIANDIIRLTA